MSTKGHNLTPEAREHISALNVPAEHVPFLPPAERLTAEAHTLPTTPISAAEVAGAIGADLGPAPARDRTRRPRPSRRRVIVFLAALVAAESALMVWLWSLIAGGAL
ncbi:hypothetical protein ACFWWU_36640 [Streptomyces sp. NPDC058650]|uniref:hypothetical protein n=1 Tax=Streptomyces sp. NPDC058650 TaxID=3346575 RepID=UPI00365CAC97